MSSIKGLSNDRLKLIAVVTMVTDHIGAYLFPNVMLFRMIGRISFPIFAFMIVEGYFRTGNLRKYIGRLLLFAILSEIPFNLAMGSRLCYPIHQNVLWSFLIALALIHWNEKTRAKGKLWLRILVGCLSVLLGYLAGILTMVDYYHAGILMVLVFYFFRQTSAEEGKNTTFPGN